MACVREKKLRSRILPRRSRPTHEEKIVTLVVDGFGRCPSGFWHRLRCAATASSRQDHPHHSRSKRNSGGGRPHQWRASYSALSHVGSAFGQWNTSDRAYGENRKRCENRRRGD